MKLVRPAHRASTPAGFLSQIGTSRIQAVGQTGLDVSTLEHDGPSTTDTETYRYMLQNDADMVDMLIGEADTGIAADLNFPIKGRRRLPRRLRPRHRSPRRVPTSWASPSWSARTTLSTPGDTPAGFSPGDAATVEAITPDEVGERRARRCSPSSAEWCWLVVVLVAWPRPAPATHRLVQPHAGRDLPNGITRIADGRNRQVAGAARRRWPCRSSRRRSVGGNLYNANNEWLGTFQVQGSTVTIAYVPARS